MSGLRMTRAPNVCRACVSRKKACDKAFPACGFCTSRKLSCQYDSSVSKTKGRPRYLGKQFIPFQNLSIPTTPVTLHSWPEEAVVPTESVDETLYQQLQHFLNVAKATPDQVVNGYLQTFGTWLPIVSFDLFLRETLQYQAQTHVPHADFTVLLLAMFLAVFPTLGPSFPSQNETERHLYTATKAACAQAQASLFKSLWLLQASLLIALREYMGVRPEAAYVSIMTCAGLARITAVDIAAVGSTSAPTNLAEMHLREFKKNAMAVIPMLERLLIWEMDPRHGLPQTRCSGFDYLSPARGNQHITEAYTPWETALFDRLLSAIRLPATRREPKLAELADIDMEIRCTLETILGNLECKAAPICRHLALCIQSLFMIQESVLETLEISPASEFDSQKHDAAISSLDMVCRMTLEHARYFVEGMREMVPLCSYYNIRAAKRHLQQRNQRQDSEGLSGDIDVLKRAEEIYLQTWSL